MNRRDFIKDAGVGALALTAWTPPVMAGPFAVAASSTSHPIPADKQLNADWIRSLYARGNPSCYTGWSELQYIGMPVGGIGSGTVYIGGDGQLWCWDIFNEHHEGVVPADTGTDGPKNPHGDPLRERDGVNYIAPPAQRSPWNIEQGFALHWMDGENHRTRRLNRDGFEDISFTAQYPVATIDYAADDCPLAVSLQAFSPFIPLDTDRSSYPAAVMSYTVENTSSDEQRFWLSGWIENCALRNAGNDSTTVRRNRGFEADGGAGVACEVIAAAAGDLPGELQQRGDFGSIAIAALGEGVFAAPGVTAGMHPHRWKGGATAGQALQGDLIGGVVRELVLAPGETTRIDFVVAWHFPNVSLPNVEPENSQRWYASRFGDAAEVAADVAENFDELRSLTFAWHDTWYDSSLPHWLLERTLVTADALATNTFYRLKDGRVWAWEGVGCCAGSCTHVWHYAQAVGRLFPDLERTLREREDYGVGYSDDGAIDFRGGLATRDATDGQAGVILRTYREHQMSSDDDFLRRVWPRCKQALEFLIAQDARDGEPDGVPVGEQHNTLDAEWFGKIPVLTSLYLAALRAGEAMANTLGDTAFEKRCREILRRGEKSVLELYREDLGFFVQKEDPAHRDAIGIGTGCYIDQVMGQWWAYQLGLGRLYDSKSIQTSLRSLWTYNFSPDMGVVRDSIENPVVRGRPYALAGDAGLVICTWPSGGKRDDWEKHWQFGYFNECMTGFEYEVAGHMIWESDEAPDLLEKGLAITRAIHDRYDARLRNPYNEIECSDHYGRAMSSYGVFLACTGFEYDGPTGHIGFKPRLTGDRFKSAFTSAEGWGSYSSQTDGSTFTASLELAHGQLPLNCIALRLPVGFGDVVEWNTSAGSAQLQQDDGDVRLIFDETVTLSAGQNLEITVKPDRS